MARRVLVAFVGSRGDNQPYIVMCKVLRDAGYSVLACGDEETLPMAETLDIPFRVVMRSTREVCQTPAFSKAMEEGSFSKMFEEVSAKQATPEAIRERCHCLYEAVLEFKPDLILFNQLQMCSALALSVALRIPAVLTLLASGHVACRAYSPIAGIVGTGLQASFMWYFLEKILLGNWLKQDGPVYEKLLQRPLRDFAPNIRDLLNVKCCRPIFRVAVMETAAYHQPIPAEFSSNIIRVGPMLPNKETQTGSEFGSDMFATMESFLEGGEAPVYFGFGSMIARDSKFMTLLCLRALQRTGLRGIFCAAWSDMSLDLVEGEPDAEALRAYCENRALFMKYAPHGVLFPRCCAIVHHGGAGTTNASVRSGVPTVILPICFDQPEHAERINRLGLGVGLKTMFELQPSDVAEAIQKCVNNQEICSKVREAAAIMDKENGPAEIVDFVDNYFKQFVETGRHLKIQDYWRTRSRSYSLSSCLLACLPCP